MTDGWMIQGREPILLSELVKVVEKLPKNPEKFPPDSASVDFIDPVTKKKRFLIFLKKKAIISENGEQVEKTFWTTWQEIAIDTLGEKC